MKIKTCDEVFLEEVKRNFDIEYIDLYRNLDKNEMAPRSFAFGDVDGV